MIEAVISQNEAEFYLRDPPREVDRLLYDELAYFEDGAEFSDQYQLGDWDGYTRLYSRGSHTAPVGLLDRTRELVEDRGYQLRVAKETTETGEPIDPTWQFDGELREYQREAVDQTLSKGGGIVSIATAGGKTAIALKLIEAISQRALVVVHTKELLYQWADRVSGILGIDPGLIGDGGWSESAVTVASIDTLVSRGAESLTGYGVAVFDECHRTAAAESFYKVGTTLTVPWRIGLSATPWRRVDGKELKIEAVTGGIAAEVSAPDLIDKGHLARPEFQLIDPANYRSPPIPDADSEWPNTYRRYVELHPTRNAAVAVKAANLADSGYRVLVNVDRISQGHLLEYALSDTDPSTALDQCGDRLDPANRERFKLATRKIRPRDRGAVFLSGEDSTATRQETIAAFERGEVPVLVSTLLKEGIDLPKLNAVVLAEGKKSDVTKIQTIGRALRPAGGDHAVIADVRDRGKYLGDHFRTRWKAFARYYGEYGPDPEVDPGGETVRSYLADRGLPLDELAVYDNPDRDRIEIEIIGYIEDYDHFLTVVRDTPGIRYDGEKNYVDDPDDLKAVLGA